MIITRIRRNRDLHKKRVAAYCRTSTDLDSQEESYEMQQEYYSAYITGHEEWEFAGIYADEKSGTKAENRPGFQRMIRDALDGKVDYILVKSLSRFSRNIVDAQSYIKLLQGNGVDIHFDKENLDTADPSCSMMLSFLSAIAQDESRSTSENVKWAYLERFKRGEYNLGNNRVLGYDCVNGKLVPNQDAGAVRLIYQLYLEGDHEAIVEPAAWDAVQERLRQYQGFESTVGHRGGRPHFLYGKVFCGTCGAPMTRRTVHGVGGQSMKIWTCRERHKGRKGNGCKGRNISEEELLKEISAQLGKPANQRNAELMERAVVEEQGVTVA